MASRQQLRDDIYLRVKPKPSEDDNLYDRHIDAIIDRYRAFFIKKEAFESGAQYLDPSILSLFTNQTCIPLAGQKDCYKGYKIFTYALPSSVIDLPQDSGVYNIETTSGRRFARIDKRDVQRFLRLPMASIDHTYYREANTLYLIKKDDLVKSAPVINADLVIGDTLGVADDYIISDSDHYPVGEGMAAAIIEAVVLELKKQGEQVSDYISDGVDE